MWVCEASEVNNWTVFAVGPNGANNNKKNKNNFASSRSDHRGPTKIENRQMILRKLKKGRNTKKIEAV